MRIGADIGLAFDGDADRCFVIDERGAPVSPSTVTGLVAARELGAAGRRDRHPQPHHVAGGAGTDRRGGGRAVRSRVGHSFIKAMMAEEQSVFGGEHSRTITSATFGAPTPGCSPRCTCSPPSARARPAVRADRRVRAL